MTSAEAAQLLAVLHGAYPGTYFDGAVGEVFANSFLTNDYGYANLAVSEWVQTMDRFPTIAELNRTIRRLKDDAEGNVRQLHPGNVIATVEVAERAFREGYRISRMRAGDSEEEMEAKLAEYMRKFPGSIAGVSL
jgi:hypothetical protein